MIRSTLLLVAFAHAGAVAGGLPPPAVEKINDRVYALLGPLGVPSPNNEGFMVNKSCVQTLEEIGEAEVDVSVPGPAP